MEPFAGFEWPKGSSSDEWDEVIACNKTISLLPSDIRQQIL